jgi:hypothetical protein
MDRKTKLAISTYIVEAWHILTNVNNYLDDDQIQLAKVDLANKTDLDEQLEAMEYGKICISFRSKDYQKEVERLNWIINKIQYLRA